MGACLPKNTNKNNETIDNTERGPPRKSLIKLKNQLKSKLNLEKDHHFNVFVQYQFWKSYRRDLQKYEKRIRAHVENESSQIKAEERAGLPVVIEN